MYLINNHYLDFQPRINGLISNCLGVNRYKMDNSFEKFQLLTAWRQNLNKII